MIQIEQVTIEYGPKTIFKQFDLAINKGDKILLKAPSGKGKSTLLKALIGFVPIKSGTITIDGIKMSQKTINDIRALLAYVSQDVDILADNMKVYLEEVFSFKANKHKNYNDETIQFYLDLLELDKSLLEKPTMELSGGERQRMGLLVAFLLDRSVILLDEVTSGLDQDLKAKVYDYIIGLESTCIIISHDSIWDTDMVRQVVL